MFIAVSYFDSTKRYTYKCNKKDVVIGDFVIVPTPKGNTVAKVMNTKLSSPSFQCKGVVRRVRL